MAHLLSPEACEDELKTITRKLSHARIWRDIFITICATIVLIIWAFSFQVSENIIEECKSACDTTGTVMEEVTSTKCTCRYDRNPAAPE